MEEPRLPSGKVDLFWVWWEEKTEESLWGASKQGMFCKYLLSKFISAWEHHSDHPTNSQVESSSSGELFEFLGNLLNVGKVRALLPGNPLVCFWSFLNRKVHPKVEGILNWQCV